MLENLDEIPIEEYISEGVIVVDRDGRIIKYNSAAKEMLGLAGHYERSHKSGRIQHGDILLFADTSVGEDDGGLDDEVLQEYGVKAGRPIAQKGILYIGIKGEPQSASYQIIERFDGGVHELTKEIEGKKLRCKIDYDMKQAVLQVEEKEFALDYFTNVANVLLLRGEELVFYQMKGYTARKEALCDILKGLPFQAKEGRYRMKAEGTHIFSYHSKNELTKDLVCCASGMSSGYFKKKLSDLNGFSVMSSIRPIDTDGKRFGAILTLTDVSTLEQSQRELSAALKELDKVRREYFAEDMFPEIIGKSASMREVKRLAAKASESDSNVFILGESGTGKSYLAKKIHEKSRRNKGPFVEINCCAIPRELLESELFGYEKGAFTGARPEGKKGILEIGDGGTVFLDEIGDMPLEMQAKLLMFIQKKSFYRIGGGVEINVNVRIITATNKDIEKEIQEKRFREDLFYRLNVLPIFMEPLRARREDLGLMIEYIMTKSCQNNQTHKILSVGTSKVLFSYDYPGNIRELENILERAFVLCEGDVIYPEHLMLKDSNRKNRPSTGGKGLYQLLEAYEKELILEELKMNQNNRVKTYQALGIGKTCFYGKLKKYKIE